MRHPQLGTRLFFSCAGRRLAAAGGAVILGDPKMKNSGKRHGWPVHYAWIVAGVTFLTLLAAAGGRAAPGVMLLPVGNEFQWSRATVSAVVSINIFLLWSRCGGRGFSWRCRFEQIRFGGRQTGECVIGYLESPLLHQFIHRRGGVAVGDSHENRSCGSCFVLGRRKLGI